MPLFQLETRPAQAGPGLGKVVGVFLIPPWDYQETHTPHTSGNVIKIPFLQQLGDLSAGLIQEGIQRHCTHLFIKPSLINP